MSVASCSLIFRTTRALGLFLIFHVFRLSGGIEGAEKERWNDIGNKRNPTGSYMYMCVCIFEGICACLGACICVWTCVYVCACVCVRVRACACACVNACVCVRVCCVQSHSTTIYLSNPLYYYFIPLHCTLTRILSPPPFPLVLSRAHSTATKKAI